MWAASSALLCAALLCMAAALTTDPQAFSGTVEMLPVTKNACVSRVAAECTKCQTVCAAVFTCLKTATVATTGVSATLEDGDNKWGIMTGTGAGCPVTPFQVTFTRPQLQPADVQDVSVGALVQRSAASSFTIKNAATFFVQGRNFQDNLVQGTMVGQCDGLSMYFSPGAFCNCQADFKVTRGAVMTVDAEQPAYTPGATQAVPVGGLYLLRVKQNPSPADFQLCNATFMAAYSQQPEPGCVGRGGVPCKPFDVQCFRKMEVQQSEVTRYNVSTCGTQLFFFNQGTDQEVTNCRDGLGVVSTLPDGSQGISSPAGVFYPRTDSNQVDATDRNWFFTLTPANLPLNASAQFDLELTYLDNSDGNLRQLQCIAEAKIDTIAGIENPTFLGLEYKPLEPNSALTAALSAALVLLPCLALLL